MKLSSLLPLALALLAAPVAADDIFLHTGRDITGVRVEAESYTKVDYRKAGVGSTQSVDTADVKSIRYGSTSPEFSQAITLRDGGNRLQAASYFLFAADDENLPDFVRASALSYAAEDLLAAGESQEALKQFDRLLSSFGSSRHRASAQLGRGKALFFTRQLPAADKAFSDLQADAASKDLGERWSLEAEFFKLWSQEAQGQDVLQAYGDLRTRTRGKQQGIANRASLRMGRVNLAAGDIDAAERLFEEIIESRLETDEEVVAGAFNGRGRCRFHRAQALERATPEELFAAYQKALLDFLRVHVSYGPMRKEQAEALYWAGVSFLNLSSYAPADEADDLERKGQILLKRCRDSYDGSEWASKAAAEQ